MPKGSRIVMADDDKMLLDMYRERLMLAGYKITAVDNGEEALARAREEKPDIVMLDVMMPKLSGYETAAALKADPLTKDIPIIILSALMRDYNREKAIESGAEDYLIKSEAMPVDVVAKIEEVLEKNGKKVSEGDSQPGGSSDNPKEQKPLGAGHSSANTELIDNLPNTETESKLPEAAENKKPEDKQSEISQPVEETPGAEKTENPEINVELDNTEPIVKEETEEKKEPEGEIVKINKASEEPEQSMPAADPVKTITPLNDEKPEEKTSNTGIIILVVIAVLILGLLAFYFLY